MSSGLTVAETSRPQRTSRSSAFVPIDLSKVPFREMPGAATLMRGGASGECAEAKTSSLAP